jgi:branched-chain amino acid transport system substrate-binding protein
MRALGILSVSTVLLAGCSFTTAGGLSECETTADCASGQVCAQNFCLPQPAGCGTIYGDTTDPNAVQMGAVLPLSLSSADPNAGQDTSEVQGLNSIRLALDELNEPGRASRKITLHVCDSAFDAARTTAQAQWLITEKKIVALLTAGSSQTLAAAAVTLPAGVLTMSSSATSPELTSKEDNTKVGLLWRTSPSDAIQGRVIANLLLNDARFNTAQKIGLLYLDKDSYGVGLFEVITERLRGSSKSVKPVPYLRKDDNSMRDAVIALDSFDPDITIVVGFEDDATFLVNRGLSSNNLKTSAGHRWFFSDSAKDAALLDDKDPNVRAEVQGAYGTAPAQGAGQAFNSFQLRFIQKYNTDPRNFSFTSHAYDSMYLLGLGVAYSQGTTGAVTSAKMAEGLTKVSSGSVPPIEFTPTNFGKAASELAAGRTVDVEGASGSLQFDIAGEAPSPIELWQVEGSNFRAVENIPPP